MKNKSNKVISLVLTILILVTMIGCNKQNQNSNTINNTSYDQSDIYINIDVTKSLFEKGYYDYEGNINQNLKIRMSLYKLGTDIVGTYFYESEKKYIKLKGKADDKTIILLEYDENGTNTGKFEGSMKTGDNFQGTWTDGEKNFSFSVDLIDIISGVEYGKRYGFASTQSDEEIEKFTQEIQDYVITNNKQNIAKLINYPIKVKINGKLINIENQGEFINNYDDIFNAEYKKVINNSFAKSMFVNGSGIMFGGNLYNMWINESKEANDNATLKITAINN